jgi:DNA-binding transcriptional ArsR family regulator
MAGLEPTPAEYPDYLDRLFEALANKHRREIVYLLGLQPYAISQLAQLRGLSLPAIHKHLAILEDAGMIQRRKVGRTTYLTLERQSLRGLQEWLSQYHAYWGSDHETLENYESFLSRPTTDEETP